MKISQTGAGKLSRKLLTNFMLAAMFCSTTMAVANEVYIEQVGDSSTIAITQDGSSNRIGTALAPTFIGSGSNTVTIDQIGSGNELDMIVNGAATDVTLSVTGNNNVQTINCGSAASASCGGSTITQTIAGDNNTVTASLGANHTSTMTITGSSNTVSHNSTNTGVTSADITVSGDTNTIGVTQSGTTAKSVTVNSTGNNNNISITQSN